MQETKREVKADGSFSFWWWGVRIRLSDGVMYWALPKSPWVIWMKRSEVANRVLGDVAPTRLEYLLRR